MFMAGVIGGLIGVGVVIGVILSKTRTDSHESTLSPFSENRQDS